MCTYELLHARLGVGDNGSNMVMKCVQTNAGPGVGGNGMRMNYSMQG